MLKVLIRPVVIGCVAALSVAATSPAFAQAKSLDELLQQTRAARSAESAENEQRIREFRSERNQQATLLKNAKNELASLERRADELSSQFDSNEEKLAELETTLSGKSGALGEMFGVVRQVSGDVYSAAQNSMVTAQLGEERMDFLGDLAESKRLPSIAKLERLWFEMQREMTELGKVVRFDATVIEGDGEQATKPVVRLGTFTAIADGEFLTYETGVEGKFRKLPKQPSSTYVSVAKDFVGETSGYHTMVVDPSQGTLLRAKIQERNLLQRVMESEGGMIGWLIIGLTVIGLIISLLKFLSLGALSAKISSQKKNISEPKESNPLGRVLQAYYKDPSADSEIIELRMDEAVLKETPAVERGLSIIKILAAIGPLLGLLGTVTGMIQVFQSITLYGTGDPKLMAGGISQALMTTVLGLVMAIPLILIHSMLASRAKGIIQTLDEESVGLIAEHKGGNAAS